ncbi:MAG: asparagine synthase (glutamine-hydrolyzing) [Desulfomonile tiedjei]|uniref:asparagine synthase (glutamine-hydrolyzing) n=1 Tax=Desulfomonile tiedjei TaxID=2358 RepID=A0A9D6YZK0_9BACT|nr:asparagine synthase (glutamine-hydrolyzing) [Desulfomonile tiedjei]
MCGIAGLVGKYSPDTLDQMIETMSHRGPDDRGVHWDRDFNVGMGMCRLSILDIASGHQPMSNEDGSIWIVYNGETYNSPSLRPALEEAGHRFVSDHSDTEVLIHLYEEHGIEALQKLNGMFAFVILDKNRKRLFAARDRMGKKPLYYWHASGLFAWASEIKSLLEIPYLSRNVDREALFHYMSLLYVTGEKTIIQGVRRLLPGHWLIYDLEAKTSTTGCYWNLDFSKKENRPEEEWCHLIRDTLGKAVKRRLLSDVPIGCSLSGGIDSSSIVGLLGSMNHSNINTYSLGFVGEGEEDWNELPLARAVSRKWGTQHHEMILEPTELLEDLVSMVWHLDEPYAGGLPSWYVFKHMRQDVTVGLTGSGGDELFGNYGKYTTFEVNRLARLACAYRDSSELARTLFYNPLLALVSHAPEILVNRQRKNRVVSVPVLSQEPMRWFYMGVWYYFDDFTKKNSIFTSTDDHMDTGALLQALHNQSGAKDYRDAIAYVDFKTQLVDEFLFFTDRLSMAHSLEARVPFLDHEFVELVMRIPSSLRSKHHDWKYLLKKAMSDLLPEEVLTAPKKGFVIPIKLWLRDRLRPLAEKLLAPERLEAQGILRPQFYFNYVLPHLNGHDFTWQVWAALMFQLWHVVFIEHPCKGRPSIELKDLLG